MIFPNLINSLSVMQGFHQGENEVTKAIKALIIVDQRLLTSAHIYDIGVPKLAQRRKVSTCDDPDEPTASMALRQAIAHLRKEVRELTPEAED